MDKLEDFLRYRTLRKLRYFIKFLNEGEKIEKLVAKKTNQFLNAILNILFFRKGIIQEGVIWQIDENSIDVQWPQNRRMVK